MEHPAKMLNQKWFRGFESLPLRYDMHRTLPKERFLHFVVARVGRDSKAGAGTPHLRGREAGSCGQTCGGKFGTPDRIPPSPHLQSGIVILCLK